MENFIYFITTILIISAILVGIGYFYFKHKNNDNDTEDNTKVFQKNVSEVSVSNASSDSKNASNSMLDVEYSGYSRYWFNYQQMESDSDTISDIALYVKVSNVNDENMGISVIYDDDTLHDEGATVGRLNNNTYSCDAQFIDKVDCFLIKKMKDRFIIMGGIHSKNGIRLQHNGEKVKALSFTEHAVIFIGPIKIEFFVPNYECCPENPVPEPEVDRKHNFFDEELLTT